jgi:hypothetical protein
MQEWRTPKDRLWFGLPWCHNDGGRHLLDAPKWRPQNATAHCVLQKLRTGGAKVNPEECSKVDIQMTRSPWSLLPSTTQEVARSAREHCRTDLQAKHHTKTQRKLGNPNK